MLISRLRKLMGSSGKPQRTLKSNRFRPRVEGLEERRLLSTLTVPAQYPTINAAVTAASAGDTIKVSSGTYAESVQASKTLKFVGVQNSGPVIVQPPAGTDGFDVTADNVTIRGFTIQDADVGINLSRANSGADIEDNIIQNNTFGIYLNSNGVHKTEIEDNQFLNNNQPGSASGNGIYSDQGVSNAEIEDNYFSGQTNASMIFVGDGPAIPSQAQSKLDIEDNRIINDAAIILVNTTNSKIDDNKSVGSNGSGIFFGGGVSNVEVEGNTLRNGAFTGINVRFDPNDYNVSTPDNNIRIEDNEVSGFGDSGIRLREGTFGNTVKDNDVTNNGSAAEFALDPTTGDGISIETGSNNNTVSDNDVEKNFHDGIHIDDMSYGNHIIDNEMHKNNTGNVGGFDAEDDSLAGLGGVTGTAGTANFWSKNDGGTQSPMGILQKKHNDNNHGHDDHDHHHNHCS